MGYWGPGRSPIMFGGCNNCGSGPSGYFQDTWLFTQGFGTRVATGSVITARWWSSMTYDERDGEVLLYGGCDWSSCYGGTWTYGLTGWVRITSSGPSPRMGAVMLYDPLDQYVVLFGGINCPGGLNAGCPSGLSDTWTFTGGTWTNITAKEAITPYSQVQGEYMLGAVMAFDYFDGYLVMYGGCEPQSAPCSTQTYTFSGGQWHAPNIISTPPAYLDLSGMAWDPSRQAIVLFGGYNQYGVMVNTAWEFQGGTWTYLASVGGPPSPRGFLSMTADSEASCLVSFGGTGSPSFTPPVSDNDWRLV